MASVWKKILAALVDDTSPQLGGNLDVNGNDISSTSDGNVIISPDGTGVLEVKGDINDGAIQLNCNQNSHGVKIQSPPHSAGASYTLVLPDDTGTNGQALTTDGSGNLSFSDVASSGTVHVGSGISNAGNTGDGASTTTYGGSSGTNSFAGRVYYYTGVAWLPASPNSASANTKMLGVSLGGNTGVGMCLEGFVKTDVTNLTPGSRAYISTNASVTTTAPTTTGYYSRVIGYAVSSSVIFFDPSKEYETV
jgi:hypothetical protein